MNNSRDLKRPVTALVVCLLGMTAGCVGPLADDEDGEGESTAASSDALVSDNHCSSTIPTGAQVKSVTPSTLGNAVANARAGDVIVLGDGTYGGLELKKSGTASSPIVIRARNPGRVTFSNTSVSIEGQYAVLACMKFHNTDVDVGIPKSYNAAAGRGTRVTRNWFTNTNDIPNSAVLHVHYSSGARIDHNDIGDANGNFRRTGIIILNQEGGKSRIDHNYLHGSPFGGGEYEALWMAGSTYLGFFDKTGFVVDHNLFESWRGDNEVITTKTSGVTIRNNTFTNCRDLNLRMGEGNLVKNNVINGRGIVIYGRNHFVIGNKLGPDAFIEVSGGSVTRQQVLDSNQGWEPSDGAIVYGNQGGTIRVGESTGTTQPLPPKNTKLGKNSSSIQLYKQTGTIANYVYTGSVGTPVGVSRSEVGPGSP